MPKSLARPFTATVVRLDTGMRYHALPVPAGASSAFSASGMVSPSLRP